MQINPREERVIHIIEEWSWDKNHGTRRYGKSGRRASEVNVDFFCAGSDLRLWREEVKKRGAKLTDGFIKN